MGKWRKGKERKMKGEEKREIWMNGKCKIKTNIS